MEVEVDVPLANYILKIVRVAYVYLRDGATEERVVAFPGFVAPLASLQKPHLLLIGYRLISLIFLIITSWVKLATLTYQLHLGMALRVGVAVGDYGKEKQEERGGLEHFFCGVGC